MRKHILRVMREFGAEQLRTDELHVYDGIAGHGRAVGRARVGTAASGAKASYATGEGRTVGSPLY